MRCVWQDHGAELTYGVAAGETLIGLVLIADACGRFPRRRALPRLAVAALAACQA